MKKVALITDGIWPYVMGGMQKHSYYLCKYFAKNGIYVDLFHFNQSELDIEKLGVFTEEEKKYIHSNLVQFPDAAKGPGHYLKNSYIYSRNVYELIKDKLKQYDFIYTKGFTGWHLLKEKKRLNLNIAPAGVKFHGYEMFQKAPDLKAKLQQILFLRKPVKEISLLADVVFSYGGRITDIIQSIGVPAGKIIELASGVEEDSVADFIVPSDNVRKFVYLGRYERRKGVEELAEALKLISNNNFEFHFIGAIPEAKQVKHPSVKYHGELRDKQKISSILRECDVLVCPSWSEGLPNVILEAMGNGLAVLATDVGATSVVVNERTGWLMPDSSSSSIKSALERVLSIPSGEMDQKKRAALDLIKDKFTWNSLIVELIAKLERR